MAARSLQGKMFEACEADDVDALARLVGEGADVLLSRKYKQLSIHAAAISDATRCLDWLLDRGVPIDARDSGLWTPAMWAIDANALGAFDLLAERGANLQALNRGGRSILHLACNGLKIDMIAELLAKGLDPNKRGRKGVTPMHSVCMWGNDGGSMEREDGALEAWRRLLAAGGRWTDKGTRDEETHGTYGEVSGTPWDWAIHLKFHGLVFRALKEFEGLPDVPPLRDVFPHPLHEAGRIGRVDIVLPLLEAGFEPAEKNGMKRTALQVCETAGQVDCAAVMRAWTARRAAAMALDELGVGAGGPAHSKVRSLTHV